MHNFYFEIYTDHGPLDYVHITTKEDIWYQIANSPEFQTNEMQDLFHKSPYDFIYNQDIKSKLLEVYPEFVNCDKNINFDSIEVHVKMIPQIEYRQHDIKFDNEMTFLEYFNSEKASVHKKTLISKEILEDAGFEDITQDWEAKYHKEQEGLEDYKTYRIWTDKFDKNPGKVLKLDIDNGLTNSGRLWHLHIDNCDCCSIGSADVDNVWQFNTLMEVFGSKFRIDVM